MNFQKQKKDFLTKKDKSKKGSIDKEIKKLVDKINSLDDYYTTSSCSGRILIFTKPKSGKKNDVMWIFSSHNKINFNEIKKIFKKIKNLKEDVWFKLEAAILHVTSRTIEDALKLLSIAQKASIKRSGIISMRKSKVSIEIMGPERLETIIAKNGKLLITNDYSKALIKEANYKLEAELSTGVA